MKRKIQSSKGGKFAKKNFQYNNLSIELKFKGYL